MKATAKAHPIQGLIKYHGMRDEKRRFPYHDSISVCTAPSHTRTTVEFSTAYDEDVYVIDGSEVDGRAYERVNTVVEKVRRLADTAHASAPVRLESENNFPTNIGLGSSSSGFAAAAMALSEAAGLDATRAEISAISRVGSASSARAVAGGFSQLYTGCNDADCYAEQIPTSLGEDLKIVVGFVPYHKETEDAHSEAADSHMFEARMAHIHAQIADMRDALRNDAFDKVFELAEHDSLSLAATTMTGPSAWLYWQPDTLAIFNRVRRLREEEDIPVYFSTDTGATVYVNTTAEHAGYVEEEIESCGVETACWDVGGPAQILDETAHLF